MNTKLIAYRAVIRMRVSFTYIAMLIHIQNQTLIIQMCYGEMKYVNERHKVHLRSVYIHVDLHVDISHCAFGHSRSLMKNWHDKSKMKKSCIEFTAQ